MVKRASDDISRLPSLVVSSESATWACVANPRCARGVQDTHETQMPAAHIPQTFVNRY
jgi:hypothetical protein